jgi:beta-glucosidase
VFQGDDPKYLKTIATPKHFAMHSQETAPAVPSTSPKRILREYYFPAFEAAFVEQAMSVMAAHNGINRVPCTANEWLLTERPPGSGASGCGRYRLDRHPVPRQQPSLLRFSRKCRAAAINAGIDVVCGQQTLASPIVNAPSTRA